MSENGITPDEFESYKKDWIEAVDKVVARHGVEVPEGEAADVVDRLVAAHVASLNSEALENDVSWLLHCHETIGLSLIDMNTYFEKVEKRLFADWDPQLLAMTKEILTSSTSDGEIVEMGFGMVQDDGSMVHETIDAEGNRTKETIPPETKH